MESKRKRGPSSKTGARTGQWSGQAREQGPLLRRRGKLLESDEVLAMISQGCPTPLVARPRLRDLLFGEEWTKAAAVLDEGGPDRRVWARHQACVELANACWQLNRGCRRRQSRPVWGEHPTRLAGVSDLDERLNLWVERLMRRRSEPADGEEMLAVAASCGARSVEEALGVLALLADATIDDVASLCSLPREVVYQAVWKTSQADLPD